MHVYIHRSVYLINIFICRGGATPPCNTEAQSAAQLLGQDYGYLCGVTKGQISTMYKQSTCLVQAKVNYMELYK